MAKLQFKSTANIKVPKNLIDQIIGQDDAVKTIKKAAKQRRHVLLIGEPGTGKSLLGYALSNLLPKENLQDILSFQNPNDENNPLIRIVPAVKGRDLVEKTRVDQNMFQFQNILVDYSHRLCVCGQITNPFLLPAASASLMKYRSVAGRIQR